MLKVIKTKKQTKVICTAHPSYNANKPPKTLCKSCWSLYESKEKHYVDSSW